MTAVDTRSGPRSADSFVGRLEQRETLDQVVRESARGTVRVAVIEGDAGIGKTHLLQVTLEQAQRLGVRTFFGRSEEMTSERPFGSIRDALDTRRADGARARANELLRRPDQQGLTFAIADALVDVVEEDVAEGPVLIALEDAHWADSGTLVAIRAISKLEAAPLAILITTRRLPRRPELSALLTALTNDGASRLSLVGLSAEECELLTKNVVGSSVADIDADLWARTAGNPLFLLEVLRAAHPAAPATGMGDGAIPTGLREVLLQTITSLEPGVVEALRVASVLGEVFAPAELAALMDKSIIELLPNLTDAVTRGVLQEDGDRLRFRHALIRDAVYEDIPSAIVRSLHRRAATTLNGIGADPLNVAEHIVRSAEPGDQEAIEWLELAADNTPDPGAAAALLQKRISLSVQNDDSLKSARLWLVWMLRGKDEIDEALRLGEELLCEGLPPRVLSDLQLVLSYLHEERSHHERAAVLADGALQVEGITTAQRTRVTTWRARLLGRTSPADAIRLAGEAISLARTRSAYDDDPSAFEDWEIDVLAGHEMQALGTLCWLQDRAGLSEAALASGDEALSLARASEQGWHVVNAAHAVGWAYLNAGRPDAARAAFLEAIAAAERWFLPTYITRGHESLAQVAFSIGDWDEALLQWSTSDRHRQQFGRSALGETAVMRSYVLAHRGDQRTAREWLDGVSAETVWISQSPATLEWVRALTTGLSNLNTGAEQLARVWEDRAQDDPTELPFIADAIRVLADGGMRDIALQIADSLPATPLYSRPAWTKALLSTDGEELSLAREQAEAGWPSVGRAWLYAQAGTAEAANGEAAKASELFAMSITDLDHLGAIQAQRAVRARMRACGLRPGSKGLRRRAASGWESLTAQEKEVVKLAAEGFTNPQIGDRLFISKRTVGTHLANVFRKLGVSSRSALRDYREP